MQQVLSGHGPNSLLPGTGIAPDAAMVTNSRTAFEALFKKIKAVEQKEKITLTIG